jgi:hypothetical protein
MKCFPGRERKLAVIYWRTEEKKLFECSTTAPDFQDVLYSAWEAFTADIVGTEAVSFIYLPNGATFDEKIVVKDQSTFEKIALELLTCELNQRQPGTLYLISGSPGHSPDGTAGQDQPSVRRKCSIADNERVNGLGKPATKKSQSTSTDNERADGLDEFAIRKSRSSSNSAVNGQAVNGGSFTICAIS